METETKKVTMEFGRRDLETIKRALSIASAKISADVRRKQKAAQESRRNLRPGAIASLAMEGGDYIGLFKLIDAVLTAASKKEGGV